MLIRHTRIDPIVRFEFNGYSREKTSILVTKSCGEYALNHQLLRSLALSRNDVTIMFDDPTHDYIIAISASISRLVPKTIYRCIRRASIFDLNEQCIDFSALALTHSIVCGNTAPIKIDRLSIFYMFVFCTYCFEYTHIPDELFDSIFGERKC